MPVSIRLSHVGTKHKPFYRMVIVDSRKKRDGAVIENIGTYDGIAGKFVTFKPERFDAWVLQGAQPSATAKRLYRQYKKISSVQKGAPPTKQSAVTPKAAAKPVSEKEQQTAAIEKEKKAA